MQVTATSMRLETRIQAVRDAVTAARHSGLGVAFVPTMGALHEGHRSLVERARSESDFVVLSIFVNPLQFGPAEDLSRYPRPLEQDERLARDAGVDLLFRPDAGEMYPSENIVRVAAGRLGARWEGEMRPGHFDGVLTVVAKLLNIVQPDVAVFGRKDLQQATLVEAMVRDLNFPVSLVVSPIVRERDGLALSSRNRFLSPDERSSALQLSRALSAARASYAAGERDPASLAAKGREVLAKDPGIRIDYFAVIDPATFEEPPFATAGSAAIVAARIGSTRLIDNVALGDDSD